MIYMDLQKDIKSVLSEEDWDSFELIIRPIKQKEHQDMMNKLKI